MDLHRHLSERIAQRRHDHPGSWSAADLAQRVNDLGVKMTRATLSKLEMRPYRDDGSPTPGARLPTLTEFLALCYALDTSPLDLLLPDDGEPMSIFGNVEMDRATCLNWMTHTSAPEGMDVRWFGYVAPEEMAALNEASRVTGLDVVEMVKDAQQQHEDAQISYPEE